MAQLGRRVFHNLQEIQQEGIEATRWALDKTLESMKKRLQKLIESHIYQNAYKRKWYDRTDYLLQDDAIELYTYKNTANEVGCGIRFNKQLYDSIPREPFQHGNPDRYLEFGSYLAIMNDSSKLHENPYHFPTGDVLERGHFYTEFEEWANKNYAEIFKSKMYIRTHGGGASSERNASGSKSLSSSTSHIPSLNTYL